MKIGYKESGVTYFPVCLLRFPYNRFLPKTQGIQSKEILLLNLPNSTMTLYALILNFGNKKNEYEYIC